MKKVPCIHVMLCVAVFWLSAAVVASAQKSKIGFIRFREAQLRPSPDLKTKLFVATVSFADRVLILERKDDWIKVQRERTKTEESGWTHQVVLTDNAKELEAIRKAGKIPSALLYFDDKNGVVGDLAGTTRFERVDKKGWASGILPGQAIYFVSVSPGMDLVKDFLGAKFERPPQANTIYYINQERKAEVWSFK
jgi:hypothetical protein